MNERTSRSRVLLVDDHLDMVEMLAEGLVDRGFDAIAVGSGKDALVHLETGRFDAVVTDLRMQPIDGFEVLAHSRALDPDRPVIIMTAFSAVDSAIDAVRQGAFHYRSKPFKLDELALFLERGLAALAERRETVALRRALRDRKGSQRVLGRSKAMASVIETIDRVADAGAPVLITGETGTGKGVVAEAIHAAGRRAAAPFVTVNCVALPESLLESELFGHIRGAFTGATESRPGLFSEANGGTIFLDEIGDMPIALQAKLLHVLERGRIRPVGGTGEREVDARIIAATHRDLRQRPEDIPELMEHFLRDAMARHPHSPVRRISREAITQILDHRWPTVNGYDG